MKDFCVDDHRIAVIGNHRHQHKANFTARRPRARGETTSARELATALLICAGALR